MSESLWRVRARVLSWKRERMTSLKRVTYTPKSCFARWSRCVVRENVSTSLFPSFFIFFIFCSYSRQFFAFCHVLFLSVYFFSFSFKSLAYNSIYNLKITLDILFFYLFFSDLLPGVSFFMGEKKKISSIFCVSYYFFLIYYFSLGLIRSYMYIYFRHFCLRLQPMFWLPAIWLAHGYTSCVYYPVCLTNDARVPGRTQVKWINNKKKNTEDKYIYSRDIHDLYIWNKQKNIYTFMY